MARILHKIVISRHPENVYKALTAKEGLSKWWTNDCETGCNVGDILKFRFMNGTIGPDMKIVELKKNQFVKWTCIDGIDEWIGTDLVFKINTHERGSVLLFSHSGWDEESEFYMHCNCKWAFFLGVSLKNYLETGIGSPHPQDPDF